MLSQELAHMCKALGLREMKNGQEGGVNRDESSLNATRSMGIASDEK